MLDWLWSGQSLADSDIWLQDYLRQYREDDGVVTIAADDPTNHDEAIQARQAGKVLTAAGFGLRMGEMEFSGRIETKHGLRVKSLRMPCVVKGEIEEMVFERVELLKRFRGQFGLAIVAFLEERAAGLQPGPVSAFAEHMGQSMVDVPDGVNPMVAILQAAASYFRQAQSTAAEKQMSEVRAYLASGGILSADQQVSLGRLFENLAKSDWSDDALARLVSAAGLES